MNKWIGISLGGLIGISHLGMIGLLATRQRLPQLNLPVGKYTAYTVEANKDGYKVNYRANAPLVMGVKEQIKKKAGFLGLGNNTLLRERQFTAEGSYHTGVAGGDTSESKKSIACIKAVGGGEQTGRMVGASVGAGVANTGLASIPYVGWVLAGAATMIGMDAGSDIGGQMVEDLNPNCEIEDAI
jgi:hypothetical protein